MKTNRSVCPVASALDIFGDKWSLVIIRDFFAGKTAFSEFLASPEKISTNILASRLKILEENGLITSSAKSKQTGKALYTLTAKGESLYPVLDAMAEWALANLDGTKKMIAI